jgi:glucose/arabinose dehydrogenase
MKSPATYRSLGIRAVGRLSALAVLLCGWPAQAQLRTEVYVTGLTAPIDFVQDPSNPRVQYVVEQAGRVRVIRGGVLQTTDFLNVSTAISAGGERGLLGLAFPVDYGSTGRFFVNFTNPGGHTVVARFKRSNANPLVADLLSRFDLRWPSGLRYIVQPFSNHNGGHLAFGPDGYLYIGMGDGGSGNDPDHRAQNPAELLGKMLRIDVNVEDAHPSGYVVPPDNPFAGPGAVALDEIWAFGLRNPWKFTFDDPARGGTGALIIGDVGQNAWEEIDYEPAGAGGRNYGWRNREGAHANVTNLPPAYQPLTDPIIEYPHGGSPAGRSVTGGFVYRGTTLGPAFRGRYFYADFITGQVWSAALTVDPLTGAATASNIVEHTSELGGSAVVGNVSSMGVDARGELYLLNYGSGRVLRVVTSAPVPGAFKKRLDFDADGRSDLVVFNPAGGQWQVLHSFTKFTTSGEDQWGIPGDVPVPGDYDGDGQSELAVWRPSSGEWFVRFSSDDYSYATWVAYQWGLNGDVPVPADFDGDARTDLAVYRPSNGSWYVRFSSDSYRYETAAAYQWGLADDIPIPGDFDGDGRAELAVFRPDTGEWFMRFSSDGYSFATWQSFQWGLAGDRPVPADFDGDGRLDLVVVRPDEGQWYVRFSRDNFSYSGWISYQWGLPGDIPLAGDVDGDSRADLVIWRPTDGRWYLRFSADNYSYSTFETYQLGATGDVPLDGR